MSKERPTTHTNNGGEDQPVDVRTQQFTSKGGDDILTDGISSLKLTGGLASIKSKLAERKSQPFNPKDCFTLRNFDDYHERKRRELVDSEGVLNDPDLHRVESALSDKFSGPSTTVVRDASYSRLISYLTDGMKNQFETDVSGGSKTNERYEASHLLFGTDIGKGSHTSDFKKTYGEKFEKYAHIVDSGPIGMTSDRWTHYGGKGGQIRIELDKEKLKKRITFTIGDSLCTREPYYIPCYIDEADECAFANYRIINKSYFTQIKSLIGSNGKIESNMSQIRNIFSYVPYIEAQLHGQIKPEHYKSVTFNFDNFATGKYQDKLKVLQMCEKLGITIYAKPKSSRNDQYSKPIKVGNDWYMATYNKDGSEDIYTQREKIIL